MTAQKLLSPCKSCDWKGDRDRDECVYCQARRQYLHICFGESLVDACALYEKHQAELTSISIPSRQLDFSGPGPKARKFNCPICQGEVQTSLNAQRTCGQPECRKEYARLADKARKLKNRERDRARANQRKREKRLSGTVG